MIERFFGQRIEQAMRFFPVVALVGARQTGKTTLLRKLLPHHAYVSLDLPSQAELAERDPSLFFSVNPPPVLIDEVQYAPGLFRHIKTLVDDDRHAMGRFVLTGSQKFTLMKEMSDSLAGRVSVMTLEGLSAAELWASGVSDQLAYIQRGGFPELWRVPELPTESYFPSYVATYLERDVRQILNVGSLRDFERFLRFLATRHAQQLDMSALATAIGITVNTAKAWLSVLEASNQIVLLEPWLGNVGKRIVKTPKVYFVDSGLVCWLLGIGAAGLATSPFAGALWEGVVFAEMRRLTAARGLNRSFWYYRDNSGLEVDFLVLGEGARLVECKFTGSPQPSDADGLRKLAALADETGNPELASPHAYVVCRTPKPYPLPAAPEALAAMAVGLEAISAILRAAVQ
jgi:predicted AAA+ superfamily ATPase